MANRRPLVRINGQTRNLPQGDHLPVTIVDGAVEETDARLTDAREWTATTVSQAEAEAGTATTRRAWTAQRVRQAIVAWWATVGTTVGKALLSLANPSAVTFLRVNADNSVTARSATDFRADIGANNATNLTTGTLPAARFNDTSHGNRAGGTLHALATSSAHGFFSSANFTKLDGIAAGATVNQTDAFLLARANHTGTQTISTVTGLQDALDAKQATITGGATTILTANLTANRALLSDASGKVAVSAVTNTELSFVSGVTSSIQTQLNGKANNTLTLTAGTGLTGGGNLTANRSFAVVYGTTAGTAAQGNDARLSDAREWTATTVSQAEAEAGTATTRRAWTAQRVRQAILAWWNGSADKTKLDGIAAGATANQTDAFLLARANHTGTQTLSTISDAGTAAAANVVTSEGDVTPGRILTVGYSGIRMTESGQVADQVLDNNSRNRFELRRAANQTNRPAWIAAGVAHSTLTLPVLSDRGLQLTYSPDDQANRVSIRTYNSNVFANWVDLLTSANVTTSNTSTTAGQLVKVGDYGIGVGQVILSNTNYNNLITPGDYLVSLTGATNGPPPNTSYMVCVSAGRVSTFNDRILQTAISFSLSAPRRFERLYDGTSWSPWFETWNSSTFTPGTAAEADLTTSREQYLLDRVSKVGDFGYGLGMPVTDMNLNLGGGRRNILFASGFQPANRPSENYTAGIHFQHSDSNFSWQIMNTTGDNAIRHRNFVSGVWQSYRTVWDDGNFNPGTAATADVVTSDIDLTPGRIPTIGYRFMPSIRGNVGLGDLNSYSHSIAGVLEHRRYTNSALNKPSSTNNANGALFLTAEVPNYGREIAYDDTETIYTRRVTNGVRQPWRNFWTSADFTPGTAASADITTSIRSTTLGEVMKVGDYGLGVKPAVTTGPDWNTITAPGFHHVDAAGDTNGPLPGTSINWHVLVLGDHASATLTQFALSTNTHNYIFYRNRMQPSGNWTFWQRIAFSPTYTANRAIVSNSAGSGLSASSVTTTELGFLSNVTSQVSFRVAVPATPTSTGIAGTWAADSTHFYSCYATNTWRRVAHSTW